THEPDDRPRDLFDRHLLRVADVDGIVGVRLHQAQDAVDEIADVGEAARLRAVAEDRHVFTGQRLRRERGPRAAVAETDAPTLRVEDADDLRVDAVLAVM